MEIKDKPTRANLKGYFVKNAIPTEANFASLIEGSINQNDDGIAKFPGQALCLRPDASDTNQMRLVSFYKNFNEDKPEWILNLRVSGAPSWNISDADGNSKFYIDKNTGNVGIGVSEGVKSKLMVSGGIKASSNDSGTIPILMESPSDGNHRGSGTQNATGLTYRISQNPASGDPIFQIQSQGKAVRFFVEHDGWSGSRDNSAWFGGKQVNYFHAGIVIGNNGPDQSKAMLTYGDGGLLVLNNKQGKNVISIEADSNEMAFADNGQIRSADNNHRILFRRSENILELREYGEIILSPGATAGKETAKVIVTNEGKMGFGIKKPQAFIDAESVRVRPQSFKVAGNFAKFYPVVFDDLGWNDGMLELEIVRANVHMDSEWRGSIISKILAHSSSWGHGSEFLHGQVYQNKQKFIGDIRNIFKSAKLIVWLRGGGTTYNWRANHPVSVEDFSAKAKTVSEENLTVYNAPVDKFNKSNYTF